MDEPMEFNEVAVVENESHDAPEHDAPEPGGVSLHRSSTKKVFGGVAGGLAERFDVDANIVRVVFVVLALVYGLGIAVYLAMWALIPRSSVPVNSEVVVPEEVPRVRWLRYAIPLGVLILAIIFISTLRHLPVFGASFAILWVVFLMAVAVLALFSPARRLTFRRLVALAFLAFVSFLIVVSGAFLITIHELGVPLLGGSGVKQWTPTSEAQIQRNYHGAFGTSTINFDNVAFSGTTYVTATQGVGVLDVYVPAGVKIDLRTHAGLGDTFSFRVIHNSTSNTPVQHAGATLVMNLEVGIGKIQIYHDYTSAELN
jgi:phage shock protein C